MSDKLYVFMEASQRMLECLEEAKEAETEKRAALLEHDIDRVEALLQVQQAITMKLEILEKRRVATQGDAGFAQMKPKEIIAAVSDVTLKEQLTQLFQNMHTAADQLRELNRASIEIAKMELRMMGSSAAETGRKEGLYTAGGKKNDGYNAGSSFDGKI